MKKWFREIFLYPLMLKKQSWLVSISTYAAVCGTVTILYNRSVRKKGERGRRARIDWEGGVRLKTEPGGFHA